MTRGPLEHRLACPVCLGATMQKTSVTGPAGDLVLDSCGRCGGIWFELGEVQRLRRHPPEAFWQSVARRTEPFRAQCHACHAFMDRSLDRCPACAASNRIDCPACAEPLTVEVHEGLRLDLCRRCRGVWFDHAELHALWRLSLTASRRQHRGEMVGDVGAWVLLDTLMYSPELLFLGARAAGMAVEGGMQVLTNAPEVATGAVEVVGDAATGVFDAILEIIGGVFS